MCIYKYKKQSENMKKENNDEYFESNLPRSHLRSTYNITRDDTRFVQATKLPSMSFCLFS